MMSAIDKLFYLRGGVVLATLMVVFSGVPGDARADTWRKPKEAVEWAFKLGAVSVALEKCPVVKGKRYGELESNARDVPRTGEARTYDEGRAQMLLLDGPDVSSLCGTALRFYGKWGADLREVLEVREEGK